MHINETFMTSDSLTSEKQSSAAALTLFELFLRPHDFFFVLHMCRKCLNTIFFV